MRSMPELSAMPYPGRVIIIGASSVPGRALVVYAVTGRSRASQRRRLRWKEDALWTEPLDEEAPEKGDVELLVYRAIVVGRGLVVSNGRQSDDLAEVLKRAKLADSPKSLLSRTLRRWTYEPDAPHFTPRISGCVLPDGRAGLSIIRRKPDGSPQRSTVSWVLERGRGKLISTYSGQEADPLPSFAGPPRDIEIKEPTAEAMARTVDQALAPRDSTRDYRVAVACVAASLGDFTGYEVQVINRQER